MILFVIVLGIGILYIIIQMQCGEFLQSIETEISEEIGSGEIGSGATTNIICSVPLYDVQLWMLASSLINLSILRSKPFDDLSV